MIKDQELINYRQNTSRSSPCLPEDCGSGGDGGWIRISWIWVAEQVTDERSRDVYSDSTPCVVTVQNARYKQRVQEERDRRPFAQSQRSPFLTRVCPELSSLFVPGKPSLSRLTPPPALPDRPRSFFFPSRCFEIPRPPQKGKNRSFPGKASPPVR